MTSRIKARASKIPIGVKASIGYFLASMISKGMSYFVTPIFTRLLSAEEYGIVAVYSVWFQIFGILAMFCLSAGVYNNGMIDYPDDRDRYSFSTLVLSNIITIIVGCIVLCISINNKIFELPTSYLILMFGVYLVEPAYNFYIARNRFELKYKGPVIWSIVIAIVPTLISLVITFKSANKINARLFGYYIPCIVLYFGFYIYLLVKSNFRINYKFWKPAVLFNLPLIPHYLSTYLLNGADRIMIARFIDNRNAGYYSLAYSIAAIAMVIWSSINASLLPYTYECCKKEQFDKLSDVTIKLLLLFSAGSYLIILLGPEIMNFLAPQEYFGAAYAIPPIIGGVFFQVLYYIYANILYYYKKTKYVMYGSIISMLLNIILNYIFINAFGYIAAGYTTLLCYLLQAIIDCLSSRRVTGINIYNVKKIVILSIIVILISTLGGITYRFRYIRAILVLILILFCIYYVRKHIKLFTQMRK